jgi:hypothetical protein
VPPPADPVSEPAEAAGTQQHADEERRAGLDRRGDREREGGGDRRRGEADRAHLQRARDPDELEDREQAPLEPADADPAESPVDGNMGMRPPARPPR